jgi:DeoR/GlpR family transcriptional regulator of sugar metabolism
VFSERTHTNADAKARIGQRAAALLMPGQTVVIDVGTTALALARAIPNTWTGTVATCSLLVALELGDRQGIDVLVCGGRIRAGDLAISNHIARSFFADLYPDVAFLGSGGVDAHAGVTDYHLDEVDVRRAILRNARQSWVLADSSKFGHVAQHRVAPFTSVSGVITEAQPGAALTSAITERGGQIHIA